MAYYIHQGQIVENNDAPETLVRSYILEENDFAYVILNEAQIEFWQENPDASVEEVWKMLIAQ